MIASSWICIYVLQLKLSLALGLSLQPLERSGSTGSHLYFPRRQLRLVDIPACIPLRQCAGFTHSRFRFLRLCLHYINCWIPSVRAHLLRRPLEADDSMGPRARPILIHRHVHNDRSATHTT